MPFGKSTWMPLALIVLALGVVLVACGGSSIQTTNPGISTAPGNKLVVIVQGIGTKLSTKEITGNGGYGDTDFGSIESSLKKTKEFSNAQYMVYSYAQTFGLDGQPASYDCNATYTQNIALDEAKLAAQITAYTTNHKNTQVYVVAHSLGGVITFAFLADLVGNSHSLALANGGVLKGIAIMDSPLGGVIDNANYFSAMWLNVHGALLNIGPGCNLLHIGEESYKDLNVLLKNAQDAINSGSSASVYKDILGTTVQPKDYLSNQTIASQAANMGARILIVGNKNDILWRPELCPLFSDVSDFLSVEYLNELGEQSNNGALYVRSFKGQSFTGSDACNPRNIGTSHGEVLQRTEVDKAILELFSGKTVDQLTIYQAPNFSQFVGQWKEYGDWMTITADGNATYMGRTHVFCSDDPRPPCDGGNLGLAGLNTTIRFTSVNGNTASGIISSGTGDRDQNNNIIPVGSTVIVTLTDKDHLHVSDGLDLTNCQDLPNAIECISNT